MKEVEKKLPPGFAQKLKGIYPFKYQKIITTFLAKKKSSFRINYSKIDLRSLRKKLIEEHVRFRELPFPKGSFLLFSNLRQFQDTDIYKQGFVFVQNVSSMIPPIILDPQDSDATLDLCAAPGAKTTQIVSLAPASEVVAIEKIRDRYYKLLANLKVQGATKVKTLLLDGIWVRKKFPEYFSKALIDAPCSAEARFYMHNPRSYKYWKERKVKEMARKQKKLLHASFFSLKEGAELVYSTCTFSPEENEVIINWFINKFKEKIEVVPISLPLPNVRDGFTRWQGKKLSASLKLTKRIIPNDFMEGFFIAKLRKISV